MGEDRFSATGGVRSNYCAVRRFTRRQFLGGLVPGRGLTSNTWCGGQEVGGARPCRRIPEDPVETASPIFSPKQPHSPHTTHSSEKASKRKSREFEAIQAFSLGKRRHNRCPDSNKASIMTSTSAPLSTSASQAESSHKRRRASRACLACRARKVRCDVVFCGKSCTNCRLDFSECVVQLRRKNR